MSTRDWIALAEWSISAGLPHRCTKVRRRLAGPPQLEATRLSDLTDAEFERPALTHHSLILITGPPDELDLRYADVKRHRRPPLGTVAVVPAGVPTHWRWRGTKSSLHVYLQPDLVERVAVEVFCTRPSVTRVVPL